MGIKIVGYGVQIIIFFGLHYITIHYNKNIIDLKVFLVFFSIFMVRVLRNTIFSLCMLSLLFIGTAVTVVERNSKAASNTIILGYFSTCIATFTVIRKLTVFRKVGHNFCLSPDLEYFLLLTK